MGGTVHACLSNIEPAHRKAILAVLREAPNPKLVPLGASAADMETDHVAGSAIRAASRSRAQSPCPLTAPPVSTSRTSRNRPDLPRAHDGHDAHISSTSMPVGHAVDVSPMRNIEASPGRRRRHHRVSHSPDVGGDSMHPLLQTSHTSSECLSYSVNNRSSSPRQQHRCTGGNSSSSGTGRRGDHSVREHSKDYYTSRSQTDVPARPPMVPVQIPANWQAVNGEAVVVERRKRPVGNNHNDSLNALMDVLSRADTSRRARWDCRPGSGDTSLAALMHQFFFVAEAAV